MKKTTPPTKNNNKTKTNKNRRTSSHVIKRFCILTWFQFLTERRTHKNISITALNPDSIFCVLCIFSSALQSTHLHEYVCIRITIHQRGELHHPQRIRFFMHFFGTQITCVWISGLLKYQMIVLILLNCSFLSGLCDGLACPSEQTLHRKINFNFFKPLVVFFLRFKMISI